jgi:hypothetical protein
MGFLKLRKGKTTNFSPLLFVDPISEIWEEKNVNPKCGIDIPDPYEVQSTYHFAL